MPGYSKIALFSSLIAYVSAQGVGTNTAETHPAITTYSCTKAGGCVSQSSQIVLDANWRWVHDKSSYTNCYTGNTWDTTLCPDDVTCAANCVLEGAAYQATYGISTSGNALTLGFVTDNSNGSNVGSRVYLMNTETTYQIFKPLNMEITFDVDVSKLPCGLNGAVYFTEMEADGGLSEYPTNTAGAKYGTGYCDSQCPRDIKFIAGKANSDGWEPSSNDSNAGTGNNGACCNEMDLWEANSISAAFTPHVCNSVGLTVCDSDTTCGVGDDRYDGVCDEDGCDFNSYRMGDTTFYGPGLTVDTTKVFTVVTQFITDSGTASGNLIGIKRFYVQNGVSIPNSNTNWPGITTTNYISDNYCNQQKTVFGDQNDFETLGGLKAMGQSLERGHVLVLSLWDDYAVNLLWLDAPYPTTADPTAPGVTRGTCSDSSGVPAELESSDPGATVIYSNIRFGELCSTFTDTTGTCGSTTGTTTTTTTGGVKTTTTSSKTTTTSSAKTTTTSAKTTTTSAKTTTTSSKTTTTKATTTTSGNTATASEWGQCGGIGYTGPTNCVSGTTCNTLNPYYSQCLP